ncbi:hypothetical protein sp82g_10 [Bacillus phage SP82G]|nr:hypothetical protein sp82g_10 [Bacillus phage SP82G]
MSYDGAYRVLLPRMGILPPKTHRYTTHKHVFVGDAFKKGYSYLITVDGDALAGIFVGFSQDYKTAFFKNPEYDTLDLDVDVEHLLTGEREITPLVPKKGGIVCTFTHTGDSNTSPLTSTVVAKEGDLILLGNEVHKVVKVLHRFRNITDLQITNWKGTETRYNLHVTEYKVLVPYDTHKEENEAMSDLLITYNDKEYVLCKIPARVGDLIRTEDKRRAWEVLQKSKEGLVLYNEKEGKQWSATYSRLEPYYTLVPRDQGTHTPTREELAAVNSELTEADR